MLEVLELAQTTAPAQMVGRKAAIGVSGLKTEAMVVSTTTALQQACSCFTEANTPLSCGQRKTLSDRKSLFSWNTEWERRKWGSNQDRIYNSKTHVFVEFSFIAWVPPHWCGCLTDIYSLLLADVQLPWGPRGGKPGLLEASLRLTSHDALDRTA